MERNRKGRKGGKSKIRDKKERKEERTAKEGKRERSNKDQRLNGHKHSDCFKVNPSICKNKTQTNARTAPPFENKQEFYLLVCLFACFEQFLNDPNDKSIN